MPDETSDRGLAPRGARRVCLIAAENDALPGAKVGGVGDVLRDVPRALAEAGAAVTVLVPSYGTLHALPGATRRAVHTTLFRGLPNRVEVWSVAAAARARAGVPGPAGDAADDDGPESVPGAGPSEVAARLHRLAARPGEVDTLVLHHPDFAACGAGRVYCDDPPGRPFATDASKFALFCAAALDGLLAGIAGDVDVLHLHDWHAGVAAALREFDPAYAPLRAARLVFSIHNLALQGVRPFAGDASALESWFPHLDYELEALVDPRWSDCVNPVAAGIRLADRVHTVSPTYASEIVRPNEPARGFHGGEGLEADLGRAAGDGRLVGILNGIDYPAGDVPGPAGVPDPDPDRAWRRLAAALADDLLTSLAGGPVDAALRAVDYVAHRRLVDAARAPRPRHLLVSVGRLVDQKMAILLEPLEDGRPALAHLLERHADDALVVLVGSGDPGLETVCAGLAARHPNLVFVARYAAPLAERLFEAGDLFLMPSSFEPCGISQLLAMRSGQPCLVHAVGGLVDTVVDDVDGFVFDGDSRPAQARNLLRRLDAAIRLRADSPQAWTAIRETARSRRFDWASVARRYLGELYAA